MESFYGGRKGESFVIAKRFKTIQEMDSYFKNHANLDEVGYGQYVIIDTENKSNFDNGKLYKRGFEGAEYVAQIVGPQGPAPEIKIVDYNSKEKWDVEGSLAVGSGLVSGYNNDAIDFRWSRMEDDQKNFKGIELGLEIPYTYFNFNTKTANWWNNSSITDLAKIKPFYYDLQLQVPRGLPGSSITNIEESIEVDNLNNSKKYLIFTFKEPVEKQNGEVYQNKTIKIPYNTIDSIKLDATGKLHYNYSYNADITETQPIKWIENAKLNNDKKLEFTLNTNENIVIDEAINYIEQIEVVSPAEAKESEGTKAFHIYVRYADPNRRGDITYKGLSGWTDLGYIRGEVGGLHIIGSLTSVDELKSNGQWVTPDKVAGYTTEKAGWGYTINEDVWVYNYITDEWYTIGKIIATPNKFIIATNNKSDADALYNQGIWLMTETSKAMG